MYISNFERDVITFVYSGMTFDAISYRYGEPVEEIHRVYREGISKVKKLVDNEKIENISYLFYCKSIDEFILRIGLSDVKNGWREILVSSLKRARDFPDSLNSLTEDFYPSVAAELNIPTRRIGRVLRSVFRMSYDKRDGESRLFFTQANIKSTNNIKISTILKSAVECIKRPEDEEVV